MKLERHVGGLSMARKRSYLEARGWRADGPLWKPADPTEDPVRLSKAIHIQLTKDLTASLTTHGWKVAGYSQRGYVKLVDPKGEYPECSLPRALRIQARRENRLVGEMTYSMFLAVLVQGPGA